MDPTSRFMKSLPLKSSGLAKPPPVQSDGLGMKTPPPLLLDRFRALVKETEEKFRVFNGGVVLPLSTDEIVRFYEIVLSELAVNSKQIINELTTIAGEHMAHGEGIADAICARIIEVPADQKLPSLYLLDSIVKNIGEEYIKYFAARLPEVFCESYAQVHPNMHQAMRHLFGTWSSVFPLSVLQKIKTQLQLSSSANDQLSVLRSSKTSGSTRPPQGMHINPKYFEAQEHFGCSTADPFRTEGIGHAGSLSPLVEDFNTESSPERTTARALASWPGFEYEPSNLIGRDEETSELHKGNWPPANPNQHIKTSTGYMYRSSGLDLSGPRALISAYGMDKRERKSNRNHEMGEQLDMNGAENSVALRPWQNTEEEEFDWEDATFALADRRQSNDAYSSVAPSKNLSTSHGFMINHGARLVSHYGGNLNLSKSGNENVPGILPNVAGPNDMAIGNFPNPDSMFNPICSSLTSEVRSADSSAFKKPWNPTTLQNALMINSHQFDKNSVFAHQIRSDSRLGNTSATPRFPNLRPGSIPVNLHTTAKPPLLQPNPIINNPIMPFQTHRGPFHYTNQHLSVSQNVGQASATPQGGGAVISGLIGSLVAQGLISLPKQDSLGLDFDQDSLKVRHEATIAALYGDLPRQCTTCGLRFRAQDEHRKHMDWHVNKNRTLKNRKVMPSPKWFVSITLWLTGAEALGPDVGPGFLPPEKALEKMDQEEEELAVPADEDQNTCALCGEPFDDFYSDETEEWMYRGAVHLYGPVGEPTVGVDHSQLGPIVHAKCRPDSHDHISEGVLDEKGESTQEGSRRKRLRT